MTLGPPVGGVAPQRNSRKSNFWVIFVLANIVYVFALLSTQLPGSRGPVLVLFAAAMILQLWALWVGRLQKVAEDGGAEQWRFQELQVAVLVCELISLLLILIKTAVYYVYR